MIPFDEYAKFDGLGLANLVRKKEVQPAELVEAAIDRIEARDPRINAVIEKLYDTARAAAERVDLNTPFCGVPFLMKDLLIPLAGAPLRSGSRFFADDVCDHDGELAKRYKDAGVVVVGKTNVPEFGLMPVTEPEAFGPTANPWDTTRTPGGSSGGSAAAVAARMVPMAHANDGGGSIRVPASCCGLFGLKPTRGRTPIGPDLGEAWHGCVCDHVLTRSVRDSAAMLDATCGPDVGALYAPPNPSRPFLDEVGVLPGRLRIGFSAHPLVGSNVHGDCVAGLHSAVELCQELGHELVEATPKIDRLSFSNAFVTMVGAEARANIEEGQERTGRKATPNDFEATTWVLGMLGARASASELNIALRRLHRAAREVSQFFEDFDLFLTPTIAEPPLLTGQFQLKGLQAAAVKVLAWLNIGSLASAYAGFEAIAADAFDFVPYTAPFNATGQPAMSVPLHWNGAGLPIGMQFVSRFGDEATLFRLAAQLEEARPWADRMPGLTG